MTTAALEPSQNVVRQDDILTSMLEGFPWGLMVGDGEGRLLFCNRAAEKLLGHVEGTTRVSSSEMVDAWYSLDQVTIVPPDESPMARAIRGDTIRDELLLVRNRRRPEGVWMRVNAWPLVASDESIEGGIVVVQEATAYRQAMQKLDLLSRAVEQTADSVIVTDAQGVIEYVNHAFVATSGYSKSEALGKTPRILKSGLHDAEYYRQMWLRLEQCQPFDGMIINRKKNGELYWAHQTITPILEKDGKLTHFVSVLQDVTQLRRGEEQKFQLQLARAVQQQFYPVPPLLAGFDIGASAHPADETGGDYFDFIPMSDGSMVIAIGDVKGHGFGAAIVMAATRAYLRCFTAMNLDIEQVLSRVNDMLAGDLQIGNFVTLVLARLDPHGRCLSYASAGHTPGFLLTRTGEVSVLESTGLPLAVFPDGRFLAREKLCLSDGDIVVFLTDGILESATPQGEQFGTERLLQYLKSHRHEPAQNIANGLYHAVRDYVKEDLQDDDITAVVIKTECQ